VEKLKKHNSSERKGQLLEDKTMIGYFRLAEKLIPHLIDKDKGRL